MQKRSLKQKTLDYLMAWSKIDPNKYIHKGELEAKAKSVGYLAENVNRRLRELFNEGLIEHRLVNGSGEYRYKLPSTKSVVFLHQGTEYELI